jgi:hypothetical protein
MLTVVTPPTNRNLCKLADVKVELGIEDNTKDSLLNRIIGEASAAIVEFLGVHELGRATYTETVAGFGGNTLMLSRTPVVSVSQILHNGSPVTDHSIEDSEAGLLWRDAGWVWTAAVGWELADYVKPNSEAPKFSVTYIAGYILPDDTGANLPLVYQRACIDTVKAWYSGLTSDPNVKSVSIDDLTVQYDERAATAELPLPVSARLGRRRRYY